MGIVGAGAMGAGIAQVACAGGHRVLLFDSRDGAAARAIDGIAANFQKLVAKGRMTADEAASARQRLQVAGVVKDLAPCALVVEAIVEDLAAKRSLFAEVEGVIDAQCILASNTSSLSITAIAAGLMHPRRVAGMHFFNPAPLMPLVEVVSGAATAGSVAATLHATAIAWRKVPVYAKSSPGFIVNRVARPFYSEALRVVSEGAADCATVDAVMREAGGFRMGPFELMDLIGNDINYAVTMSVWEAFYYSTRFTPSALQRDLVAAGHLGKKTGRGYFDYSEGAAPLQASTRAEIASPKAARVFGSSVMAEKLAKGSAAVVRAEAHADGRLATCDGCVIYASDGRTATQRAADVGESNVLLVDMCLDVAESKRIAVSAAKQSDPAVIARGVAFRRYDATVQTAGSTPSGPGGRAQPIATPSIWPGHRTRSTGPHAVATVSRNGAAFSRVENGAFGSPVSPSDIKVCAVRASDRRA